MAPTTVVVVEKYPFGTVHHNLCVADVFTKDTLTVSCPDLNDRQMAVYGPHQWRSATVLTAEGHVLYGHVNETIREREAAHVCR